MKNHKTRRHKDTEKNVGFVPLLILVILSPRCGLLEYLVCILSYHTFAVNTAFIFGAYHIFYHTITVNTALKQRSCGKYGRLVHSRKN
jgi:hypothetical protein